MCYSAQLQFSFKNIYLEKTRRLTGNILKIEINLGSRFMAYSYFFILSFVSHSEYVFI